MCAYNKFMISDKQKKLLAFGYSKYDSLIAYGSIRSGKTALMTVAFIDWAMRNFNGQRFGICGVTVGAAVANVIDPYLALSYARKKYALHYTSSNKLLTVTKGAVTNTFEVFGGKDEASYKLIQGRTLAGVLLDEVALMPRSFVNQATARCSVDGSKLWFNCNPDNPRHWFYLEYILKAAEKNALVLHFELADNPSLSDTIIKRYESMYHGVFYDRYIRGLWVVAEGLVYQFESESEYTCTDEEARGLYTDRDGKEREGQGIWYISLDYGITNPFAALLWRVTPQCAYIVDEYYFAYSEQGRRRTDAEHADAVEELAGGRPIEDIIVDPSASSFKEEMWRRDRYSVYDADNSVLDGIQVTDQMLHDGSVKISERCVNTIQEMGLYRWDDKSAKTQPIKENDHALDACRYLANTVLKYELAGYA